MGIIVLYFLFLVVGVGLYAWHLQENREEAAAGQRESSHAGCGCLYVCVAILTLVIATRFAISASSHNKSSASRSYTSAYSASHTAKPTANAIVRALTSPRATASPTTRPTAKATKQIVFKRAPTPPPETLALLSPRPSSSPTVASGQTPEPSPTAKATKQIVFKRAPTPPPETLALLSPKPSGSPTVASGRTPKPGPTATLIPTARRGDNSETVRVIQTRLIELGYLNDRADGVFGPKTESAVAAFQQSNGLIKTGIVNGETYLLLLESVSPVTAAPRATQNAVSASVAGVDYRASASKGTKYVLNTSSMKFHYPGCRYVSKIKPSNYKEFRGSRDDVISQGYVPCKVCGP